MLQNGRITDTVSNNSIDEKFAQSSSKISNNKKVLFITNESKLRIASLDGRGIEPFNKDFDNQITQLYGGSEILSVSPNKEYLIISGIDANDLTSYDDRITWSHDYNYFAVEVRGAQPDSADKFARNPGDLTNQLYIYFQDGKLISKMDVPGTSAYFGNIFSSDNKKILMYGVLNEPEKRAQKEQVYWKVFSTEKDNDLISEIYSPDLGRVIYWYE